MAIHADNIPSANAPARSAIGVLVALNLQTAFPSPPMAMAC
jgi:hypothetical protein